MRFEDAPPRTWLLATLAGWAVLAWVLALAGMGKRVEMLPEDPGLLRPLPPLRAAATERLGPLAQYGEIGARPLFATDRRPKPFSLQGDGAGEAEAAKFDFMLTSVLITPSLRMAILQPPDGSSSVRVRLGEAPESHPGWRLGTLNPRSAVFEGPDGERTLELRVFNGQGGQSPTPSAPSAPRRAGTADANGPVVPPPRPILEPPPASGTPPETVAPKSPPTDTPADTPAPSTDQAQMEAIRQRIQARREQLRQQQSQTQPPAK